MQELGSIPPGLLGVLPHHRLAHKGYPESTGVDYVYDLVWEIRQVNDAKGTYAFAYNNMGWLLGTTTS